MEFSSQIPDIIVISNEQQCDNEQLVQDDVTSTFIYCHFKTSFMLILNQSDFYKCEICPIISISKKNVFCWLLELWMS